MTKDDLKNGMMVTLRNGCNYVYLEINGEKLFIDFIREEHMPLYRYSPCLRHIGEDKIYDVVKVYEGHECSNCKLVNSIEKWIGKNINLIWERKKEKEMTISEIEKELGYSIKVVKE